MHLFFNPTLQQFGVYTYNKYSTFINQSCLKHELIWIKKKYSKTFFFPFSNCILVTIYFTSAQPVRLDEVTTVGPGLVNC